MLTTGYLRLFYNKIEVGWCAIRGKKKGGGAQLHG
jgi:hypothetical protein